MNLISEKWFLFQLAVPGEYYDEAGLKEEEGNGGAASGEQRVMNFRWLFTEQ